MKKRLSERFMCTFNVHETGHGQSNYKIISFLKCSLLDYAFDQTIVPTSVKRFSSVLIWCYAVALSVQCMRLSGSPTNVHMGKY